MENRWDWLREMEEDGFGFSLSRKDTKKRFQMKPYKSHYAEPIYTYSSPNYSNQLLYRGIDSHNIGKMYRPERSGVIIKYGNYFCLGQDTKSSDLSDFGGGIKYSRDSGVIMGTIRELKEESLGVFNISFDTFRNNSIVYGNEKMAIFILTLPETFSFEQMEVYQQQFMNAYERYSRSEMKNLYWIPQDELLKSFHQREYQGIPIYSRVCNLFRSVRNLKMK